MLLNRLTDHILGKVELSATQVRGIEVLLKKTLPDLSSVEHSGEVATRDVSELSTAELTRRVELLRGAAGTAIGEPEPDPVHRVQ